MPGPTRDAPPAVPAPAGTSGRSLRQPRQPRAWATLERILDTAEHLLDGRDFHELSLGELITESGVSSSSLYARFRTKEALIDALHERHQARMMAEFEHLVTSALEQKEFPSIVREAVRGVLDSFCRNATLIRAFIIVEWTHPTVRRRRSRMDAENIALLDRIMATLAPAMPEQERRAAVEATFWLGDGVARLVATQNRQSEMLVQADQPDIIEGIASPLLRAWARHRPRDDS